MSTCFKHNCTLDTAGTCQYCEAERNQYQSLPNQEPQCKPYDSREQLDRIEKMLNDVLSRPVYFGIDWAKGEDTYTEQTLNCTCGTSAVCPLHQDPNLERAG